MPWNPEDWDAWLGSAVQEPTHNFAYLGVLYRILRGLPGHWDKSLAIIGGTSDANRSFLDDHFGGVVAVELHASGRERFHVALAEDAVDPSCTHRFDASLSWIHGRLREGGVLLASFPADPRRRGPFPFRLDAGPQARAAPFIHEVELQYRLGRCGFQGTRIRRYPGPDERDRLLVMAVRRALN